MRMLCEMYLTLDDELAELTGKIESSSENTEKAMYVRTYLLRYFEREDVKSKMRNILIKELINGVDAR